MLCKCPLEFRANYRRWCYEYIFSIYAICYHSMSAELNFCQSIFSKHLGEALSGPPVFGACPRGASTLAFSSLMSGSGGPEFTALPLHWELVPEVEQKVLPCCVKGWNLLTSSSRLRAHIPQHSDFHSHFRPQHTQAG